MDDYVVFEFLRKDKGGGGLLTAVHKNLQPVSVSDDTDTEVLGVEGKINDKKARFINGYGPQENYDEEKKLKFFNRLDLEIKSSKVAGAFVCIELDANSKLGPCFVPSAPGEQSKNGKMLERVIKENDLIVVNGMDLC